MATDPPATVEAFRSFIKRARHIEIPTQATTLNAFAELVEKGRALLLRMVPGQVADLRAALGPVRSWLLPTKYDLLRVVGATWDENAYTELLAWALGIDLHPETALLRQQCWLHSLGLPSPTVAAATVTQMHTDDGIPDLILKYPNFVVIVEAKTGTAEHAAPRTGLLQTVAYPLAVRRKLALPDATPIHMVFLTLDGAAAANPEAITTRYLDYALATARHLPPDLLPVPLQTLLANWLAHLINKAAPPGLAIRTTLELLFTDAPPDAFVPYLREVNLLHLILIREART